MVADGGPVSLLPELKLKNAIHKYGAEAVLGRTLYYHEILNLNAIEDIISAYNARFASEDWARWAQENPWRNKILAEATKLAEKHGW